MLRRFGWLVLVVALVVPGTALAQTAQQDEAARSAIAKLWVEYAAAIQAKDMDRWMALWADGGVQMPPGAPPNVGNDMIRANNAFGSETYSDFVIDPQETTIMGDWAYSRGMYKVTVTPGDGSAAAHIDGKFMTVLRKQADGSWKIYRDIFNSNVPAAPPS